MPKYTSIKDVDKMLEERLERKTQNSSPAIEKLRQIALRSKGKKW